MSSTHLNLTLWRLIKFAVAGTILFIGFLILTPFPHYVPPNFDRGFLRDKEAFFYSSGYFVGFYAHIFTAPIGLLLGTIQFSTTVRTGWPKIHRRIGKAYILLALMGVAPGGAVMATRAYGDLSSVICFGLISACLWWTTFKAWRLARAMRFREHGQWMMRSYTLMCSAIMLRLISYALSQFNLDHTFAYQLSVWLSWIPAMMILEIVIRRRSGRA